MEEGGGLESTRVDFFFKKFLVHKVIELIVGFLLTLLILYEVDGVRSLDLN